MTRTIQRSAILLAAIGLIAGLSPVTASGRTEAKTAPKVAALARPPVIDAELHGRRFSPSFAGTSTSMDPQVNDGSAGMPAGTESVIGPDGRVQVTDTETYPASAIGQIELTSAMELERLHLHWLVDRLQHDPHVGPLRV